MTVATARQRRVPVPRTAGRALELVLGVVAMMVIAGVLFVWPLLRIAPGGSLAESLAATQNAFATFILAETVFVPLEARLGDRFPRWLLVGAGVLFVAIGAIAGPGAQTLRAQVGWAALGGVGAGLVYGGTVAKALKRFTERKAVCVGVTAGACASVLALGLAAIGALSSRNAIPLLVVLGAGQAVVILLATLFIVYPPPDRPPPDW